MLVDLAVCMVGARLGRDAALNSGKLLDKQSRATWYAFQRPNADETLSRPAPRFNSPGELFLLAEKSYADSFLTSAMSGTRLRMYACHTLLGAGPSRPLRRIDGGYRCV